MPPVTRRDRMVDLAALLLILAGAALYVDGTTRLRGIMQLSYAHPGPRGVRQLDLADHARYEALAGMALVVVGGLTGVASALRVVRRKRPS